MTAGDRTGTTFGRYELGELLGRGGMGEVYRAIDTKNDRTVALKLLPAALADDETYAERFRRESQAVARLDDPHIIPIHDFGEIDGTLYLDMRVVEGSDLRAAIRGSGKLAPARVVGIVDDVAQALDSAHVAGLVHRDVKPENILLTPNDFAYLVDFGIARTADGADPHLTKLGTAIGSVAYIAPEIYDDGEATAVSDVYSLAVVAFEALTGRLPHRGATQAAAIKAALLDDPPLASSVDPSVPVGFDQVLSRGLARDPDQRFATAGEFAAAVRLALDTGASWSATAAAGPAPIVPVEPAATAAGEPAPTAPVESLAPAAPVDPAPVDLAAVAATASGPVATGPMYPTGPVYANPPGYATGGQYYGAPPETPKRSRAPLVLAALAVLLLIGGAVGVFATLNSGGGDAPPTTAAVGGGRGFSDPTETETETEPATTTLAQPPANSTPCDETVGVGSTVTSCPFAAAVRDAYLAAGLKGDARTVTAHSPTTNQSYSMACVPEGAIVVCRGGNDAVVHIY